jgi:hypothetical protein
MAPSFSGPDIPSPVGRWSLQVKYRRYCRSERFAQPFFLVQTVRIPAVLVHCHCVKTELSNGFGWVNLTDRNAAVPANAKIAAMSTISLRVHNVQIIAVTPIPCADHRSKSVVLM